MLQFVGDNFRAAVVMLMWLYIFIDVLAVISSFMTFGVLTGLAVLVIGFIVFVLVFGMASVIFTLDSKVDKLTKQLEDKAVVQQP